MKPIGTRELIPDAPAGMGDEYWWAGFGAAIRGARAAVPVLHPLDCRVESAPGNDKGRAGRPVRAEGGS